MKVEREMVLWLHQHHPVSASISLERWQQVKQDVAIKNPMLKHDVTLWRQTQIEQGLLMLGYDLSLIHI